MFASRGDRNPLLMTDGSLIFEAAGHLWMQSPGGDPARRIEESNRGALAPSDPLRRSRRTGRNSPSSGASARSRSLCSMELATGDGESDRQRRQATRSPHGARTDPAWSSWNRRDSPRRSSRSRATAGSRSGAWRGGVLVGPAQPVAGRSVALHDGERHRRRQRVQAGRERPAGRGPEPVTNLTRHASDGLVSPDGKWLAFRRSKEIWIARLADSGKAPGPLADSDVRRFAEEGGDGFSFASDSPALIYAVAGHGLQADRSRPGAG